MSGLLDSLSSAANALNAQRLGLDVAGQNIANINTPGYSRRMLVLAELAATDPLSAGRGVNVVGIRAMRDLLVEARLRHELGGTARDATLRNMLSTVEAAVGMPGSSLDAEITGLFDAFSNLADDPLSASARDAVVRQGSRLGQSFGDMVAHLTASARDADATMRSSVTELNGLATELAELNVQLTNSSYDVESLRDRQTQILSQMSGLADISVLARADGGVDVTLASGKALVIGERAYALGLTSTPAAGIMLEGVNVTADFTGGRIGGALHMRDTVVPGYISQLDQLAFDLANAVNAVHQTGFDANGAAAGVFFTVPAGVAGAASAMTVDAALLADSSGVAASATGEIGDNGIALQLAGLRDAKVTGGGTRTAVEAWSQFLYSVGNDVVGAQAAESSHGQIVRQLQALRDQASGVSYDEEAAHLMRYQRAYEANARYFTTILETIDSLLEMVR